VWKYPFTSTGWAISASSRSYLERETGAVNACMYGLYMLHLSILFFSWIVSPCRGTSWAVLLSLSVVRAIELHQQGLPSLCFCFFFSFYYPWFGGFDCKVEHLYPAHPVLNLKITDKLFFVQFMESAFPPDFIVGCYLWAQNGTLRCLCNSVLYQWDLGNLHILGTPCRVEGLCCCSSPFCAAVNQRTNSRIRLSALHLTRSTCNLNR